ncbi:hinge connector of long tail fiber protein distal connector [Klebsiella phage vB_KpnM_KpV477]|uniref:Putative hinge connector of long tail fiber distal connector n=1 Tax=Klebsiella phage vB_KpnM_KpV477 TaxID=1852625 RepID=A0A1B1P998_9CAUD|nr:hinge connector of long tail fiber protein distal connector [Klebsiella phage vB_KpnM_KpV477]ANT40688.1 putative hinge connector of long tail fiber distal connector [Klebsiella phage vB_KpnM_KpV477]UNY41051.1 tail fibers protein [Klebsiella phage KP182]
MADLKAGSTVGGNPIWHAGTFPLVPAGNSLTYRGKKVYTEIDKPQAADNDFVSKSRGGTYAGELKIVYGSSGKLSMGPLANVGIRAGGSNGEVLIIGGNSSIQLRGGGTEDSSGIIEIAKNGNLTAQTGRITANVFTSKQQPSGVDDLTRKDYVDGLINTVSNVANAAVKKAGDTMTGVLRANAGVVIVNKATSGEYAPRLDQVISRGVTIDFGTY